MQIYTRDKGFKLSYSSLPRVTVKTAMKYLKFRTIKGYNTPRFRPPRVTVQYGYDRYADILIGYNKSKYRYSILIRVRTKAHLNCSANHRRFYATPKLHFRNDIYLIPLAFTEDFLNDDSNFERYRDLSVVLYRKVLEVKLGFCGSHINTPHVYSHLDRW